MADRPFDREVINQRERPLSSDINTGWSYADQTARYLLDNLMRIRAVGGDAYAANAPATGFLGDGLRVVATSPASMAVNVSEGLGFYVSAASNATDIGSGLTPGILGLDDDQRMHPLPHSGVETLSIPAADPVNPRIDIVEVKLDRRLEDATSRQILDPGTGLFSALSVNKTLAFDLFGRTGINTGGGDSTTGIAYKTGTPAAVPTAPATSSGYVKIAEVLVDAAAVSVPENNVTDLRPIMAHDGVRRIGLRATVNSTINATPAALDVLGAPGFTACSRFVPGGAQVTEFWIFGGDLTGVTPEVQAQIQSSALATTSDFHNIFVHDVATGALTAGDIVNLAAAFPTTLAPTLAVGQPYVRVDVAITTYSSAGPTVGAIGFSNPHYLHLDVALR